MLRSLIFAFLVALPLVFAAAQKTPFRYMAGSNTATQDQFVQEGEIYQKALDVYNKLVEARGDRRFAEPALFISQAEGNIAFLSEDGKSIAIEEKAFNYCKSLPDGKFEHALASLLAHELTHYYEKHLWSSTFASEYSDLAVGTKINKVQDRIIYETQADYLGGFLAYSAGYDVFNDLPEFIAQMYQEYWPNKEPKMEGYPSLADRKTLAKRSIKKVNEFVQLFEMANIMTALGRYDDARAFYRHILSEYQSPTIYNNMGIVTVLEATEYFEKEDKQVYRMPLELDLRFKIGGRGFGGEEKKWMPLLREAIRYFDSAIGMNADYAPAYLNKACAHFLLKDYSKARFYAVTEAIGKANANTDLYPNTTVGANMLAALITYEENISETTKQQALNALDAIIKQDPNNLLAAYNRAQIAGEGLPQPDTRKGRGPTGNSMDGVDDLEVYVVNNEFDYDLEKELSGGYIFRKWDTEERGLKNSVVYFCQPPRGSKTKEPIKVQLGKVGAKLPLRGGFEVGKSTKAEILAKYKEPKLVRNLPNGEIHIYREVLLFYNEKGVLQRWGIYY